MLLRKKKFPSYQFSMIPTELKAAYERDENIIALLRKKYRSLVNTEELIESVTIFKREATYAHCKIPLMPSCVQNYAGEIARLLHHLLGAINWFPEFVCLLGCLIQD
jgi:hypothetical protein